MFVTKQVFDPALEGKAVVITGLKDEAKSVLVSLVNDDTLRLVDRNGIITCLKMNDVKTGKVALEILEPKTPKPVRTTAGGKEGRKIVGKHIRSTEEIERDEEAVLAILASGQPMLLRDIIEGVTTRFGRGRWTNKNASGFMAFMIRRGLPIERLDYGRYRYKGGDTV